MQETVILKNLSIGYDDGKSRHIVAQALNAPIISGQLTCLLGRNGVGKSTLLRTIAGFQPPIAGQIVINNRPLNSYTKPELAQLISVVLTGKPQVQNMRDRKSTRLNSSHANIS